MQMFKKEIGMTYLLKTAAIVVLPSPRNMANLELGALLFDVSELDCFTYHHPGRNLMPN